MINTLIRAVEIAGFAKIGFGETYVFNGSNQRIDYTQRPQSLRVLAALTLYFYNHHHLSLYLSMTLSTHMWCEARFCSYFEAFPRNLVPRTTCECSASQIGTETNDGDSESREQKLHARVSFSSKSKLRGR